MSLSVSQVTVTPVVTAGAYSAGDSIGGLLKFKGVKQFKSGYVHSVTVFDDAGNEVAMDLSIYRSNPSGSTVTDNAAPVLVKADADDLIGIIQIASTDWVSYSGGSIAHAGVKSIPFSLGNGSELFGILTTTGTPSFGTTSDLVINLGQFNDE